MVHLNAVPKSELHENSAHGGDEQDAALAHHTWKSRARSTAPATCCTAFSLVAIKASKSSACVFTNERREKMMMMKVVERMLFSGIGISKDEQDVDARWCSAIYVGVYAVRCAAVGQYDMAV